MLNMFAEAKGMEETSNKDREKSINRLQDLGFPTHAELECFGLTGPQFYDVIAWMSRGRKRFGDGWLRRVRVLTGWEVLGFLRSMERSK